MQTGQPSTLTPTSYGMPLTLTCVCTPNQPTGLGAYGGGLSTSPIIGQSTGQTMVYNVPGKKKLILMTFMKNKEYSYVYVCF
jgi:hypothetical protein